MHDPLFLLPPFEQIPMFSAFPSDLYVPGVAYWDPGSIIYPLIPPKMSSRERFTGEERKDHPHAHNGSETECLRTPDPASRREQIAHTITCMVYLFSKSDNVETRMERDDEQRLTYRSSTRPTPPPPPVRQFTPIPNDFLGFRVPRVCLGNLQGHPNAIYQVIERNETQDNSPNEWKTCARSHERIAESNIFLHPHFPRFSCFLQRFLQSRSLLHLRVTTGASIQVCVPS